MHSHGAVHIVAEVGLNTVEDLDALLGGGVVSVWEGMGYAVIGDGNGSVTPGKSALDYGPGIGEGVHSGHTGVEVQLHTLFPLRHIPADRLLAVGNACGLEHHVVFKAVHSKTALDQQMLAQLQVFQDRLIFRLSHKLGDPDRTDIVSEVEADHLVCAVA